MRLDMLRHIFRRYVDFDYRMGCWHIWVDLTSRSLKQDTCV